MPNIIDILARALSLRQETALNSITPNRAGGIMYDTLLVLNQMQLEGGSLLISKVYSSVAAMEADTTPTSDLTGRALKPGQLVVIVTSDSSSSDMGSEYRFNGPGSWTYVGKVGGLPLDTVPTQSSTKGITSGGVYTALAAMKAEGYKYMGLATPGSGGTAPGTPNQPVFYVAAAGSYPNFGSLTVASGHLGFLKYSNGSWTVESIEVGKDYDEEISQLQAIVDDIFDIPEPYKTVVSVDQNYWVNTNNVRESTTSWKSSLPIFLKKGDRLFAKLGYIYNAERGLLYRTDATMSFFSLIQGSQRITTQQDITYTASEDCYVLIQSYTSLLGECYVLKDSERMLTYDEKMKSAGAALKSTMTFSEISVFLPYWVNQNGERVANANWRSSLPVHLMPGYKVEAQLGYGYDSASRGLIYLTDAEMSFFTLLVESNYVAGRQDVSYTAETECYVLLQSGPNYLGTCIAYNDSKRLLAIEADIHQLRDGLEKPWVKDEIERILGILDTKQQDELVVIGFNSDQHINAGADNDTVMRGLWALNHLAKNTAFNVICLGGDSAGYGADYNSYEKIARDMAVVTGAVDTDFCPVISIAGNHEAATNFSQIPRPDGRFVFNGTLKRAVVNKKVEFLANNNTSCYFDDLAAKIRFVFLDSWTEGGIQSVLDLLSIALSDAKLYNGDWGVIFISHNVITPAGDNTDNPMSQNVWDYIKEKIDDGLNVVMCINGHSHRVCQGVKDNIPLFGTTQARFGKDGAASFDGVRYNRKANSPTETSFDVYVYDKTDGIIYVLQYGAGTDRQFNTNTHQFEFCVLSGNVSIDGGGSVAGGKVTANYHNTVYEITLDATGNYQFDYLCPGRTWTIKAVVGADSKTESITSIVGALTKDITI